MAFPSTTPTKANLDESTDSPASARSELATLVDLVTQIIQSYAQVSGICDLNASGQVPAARLPGGASSGVDADLLDGEHGSFYRDAGNLNTGILPAARFNNTAHGNRSGGTLHDNATTSIAGFMSASDKVRLNGVVTGGTSVGSGGTNIADIFKQKNGDNLEVKKFRLVTSTTEVSNEAGTFIDNDTNYVTLRVVSYTGGGN